jgi:hypothetical protein
MMAQKNDLTSAEVEALREVNKGLMQRVIPDHIRDSLIKKKYIAQKTGGLGMTAKGKIYLGTHRK